MCIAGIVTDLNMFPSNNQVSHRTRIVLLHKCCMDSYLNNIRLIALVIPISSHLDNIRISISANTHRPSSTCVVQDSLQFCET
uniref:Ovule protein n=1 Tax=Heterorhabditis bacteriophora TaxID=37862 RepID=A0A1I7XKJ4_HETBA